MESNDNFEQMSDRPIAAALGVVFRKKAVILVRRTNKPDAGRWGFPGGKINKGETIAEAAIRELYEETGVTATAKQVVTAIDFFDRREEGKLHGHYILVAVLCEWVSGEPVPGDDAHEAGWFTRAELEHGDMALSAGVLKVLALAESALS